MNIKKPKAPKAPGTWVEKPVDLFTDKNNPDLMADDKPKQKKTRMSIHGNMTRRQSIMRRAWAMSRTAARKYGGNAKDYMKASLEYSHKVETASEAGHRKAVQTRHEVSRAAKNTVAQPRRNSAGYNPKRLFSQHAEITKEQQEEIIKDLEAAMSGSNEAWNKRRQAYYVRKQIEAIENKQANDAIAQGPEAYLDYLGVEDNPHNYAKRDLLSALEMEMLDSDHDWTSDEMRKWIDDKLERDKYLAEAKARGDDSLIKSTSQIEYGEKMDAARRLLNNQFLDLAQAAVEGRYEEIRIQMDTDLQGIIKAAEIKIEVYKQQLMTKQGAEKDKVLERLKKEEQKLQDAKDVEQYLGLGANRRAMRDTMAQFFK